MKGTDFIAELEFLTTEQGGRKGYAKSGYRPHIEFENYSEYLTSGQQTYVGREIAEKGESKLCEELLEETNEKGIEIVYFRTLADFAKQHASVIEFITKEWFDENIDNKIIDSLFEETLDNIDDDLILDGIELEHNESKTGHLNRTDYLSSNLIDFYVYEKADGTILLNAEWEFEAEFEIEIERVIEREIRKEIIEEHFRCKDIFI